MDLGEARLLGQNCLVLLLRLLVSQGALIFLSCGKMSLRGGTLSSLRRSDETGSHHR